MLTVGLFEEGPAFLELHPRRVAVLHARPWHDQAGSFHQLPRLRRLSSSQQHFQRPQRRRGDSPAASVPFSVNSVLDRAAASPCHSARPGRNALPSARATSQTASVSRGRLESPGSGRPVRRRSYRLAPAASTTVKAARCRDNRETTIPHLKIKTSKPTEKQNNGRRNYIAQACRRCDSSCNCSEEEIDAGGPALN